MQKHDTHSSSSMEIGTPVTPDIKQLALEFADKYHPGTECVILTGSQIEPDFLTSQSDIDIVLIGSQFHDASSSGAIDGGHKIDFTMLGYRNIVNTLVDVSYNSQGIVIDMIRNGVILRDETGIGKLVQEYCREAFEKGCRNSESNAKSLSTCLVKLKKQLLKNLDGRYIPFLAGDFLRLIASSHLFIYNNSWYPYDGFRLAKIILKNDGKSAFLNDLVHLHGGYIEKPQENVYLLLLYVDKYLDLLAKENSGTDTGKLILNIDFRDQNPECFFGEMCAAVLAHPYLSNYFTYGHIHTYRYIFNNRYCFVFDTTADGYEESRLIKELDGLFWQHRRRITDMRIVNHTYMLDLCGDAEILKAQESLLSYIHKEVVMSVSENGYNEQRIFLLGIILSITIVRAFGITDTEARELFDLLYEKWLPADSAPLTRSHFDDIFAKNKPAYKTIWEHFVSQAGTIDGGIDLRAVSEKSRYIADAVTRGTDTLPELCVSSLKADTATAEKTALFWHIIGTLEMSLDTIGIDHKNRSYAAWVVKRLFDS